MGFVRFPGYLSPSSPDPLITPDARDLCIGGSPRLGCAETGERSLSGSVEPFAV